MPAGLRSELRHIEQKGCKHGLLFRESSGHRKDSKRPSTPARTAGGQLLCFMKRTDCHHISLLLPPFKRSLLCLILLGLSAGAALADDSFLDNGQVRLGVKTDAGACIDYFALSGNGQNVINGADHGRYVQQSYYGNQDGSSWAGHPWSWNPVQGGSWDGKSSRLLEFSNDGRTIHAVTMPKHWATGADLPDVRMEEWINLEGTAAHIHYKMSYSGNPDHHSRDQEMPAVFLDRSFSTLIYYKGKAPWTLGKETGRIPKNSNEYDVLTEHWAAYVNASGLGVGIYVPEVHRMTFYLHDGKGGPGGDGCAYIAPIENLAITRGFVLEYDAYLILGSVHDIRATVYALNGTPER